MLTMVAMLAAAAAATAATTATARAEPPPPESESHRPRSPSFPSSSRSRRPCFQRPRFAIASPPRSNSRSTSTNKAELMRSLSALIDARRGGRPSLRYLHRHGLWLRTKCDRSRKGSFSSRRRPKERRSRCAWATPFDSISSEGQRPSRSRGCDRNLNRRRNGAPGPGIIDSQKVSFARPAHADACRSARDRLRSEGGAENTDESRETNSSSSLSRSRRDARSYEVTTDGSGTLNYDLGVSALGASSGPRWLLSLPNNGGGH